TVLRNALEHLILRMHEEEMPARQPPESERTRGRSPAIFEPAPAVRRPGFRRNSKQWAVHSCCHRKLVFDGRAEEPGRGKKILLLARPHRQAEFRIAAKGLEAKPCDRIIASCPRRAAVPNGSQCRALIIVQILHKERMEHHRGCPVR